MKILIVDDAHYTLRKARKIMEEAGWEILTAETGANALELFEKHKESLDLITLDIFLPDIDGITLLKRISEQRHKLQKQILIFMVTAYDYRDDFAVWASEGYIIKSHNTWEEVLRMFNEKNK